ncbi:hypothetical protein NP493_1393g00008 [Ridgeia piscesae]|uniref:ATP synthase peripheral stalk subunit OSCP, mitochondrial n=1 Tax=Ridgeia piscesae TaxID=27915 RepID=A0AAD9K4S8_RIDPI|nr:hypothetical protein NP493_1393g00008 [Ridgeia piscesae]
MATATKFGVLARKFSSTSVVRGKLVTPPVPVFGIEGRYAHALYSAASKNNTLDTVEGELKRLQGILKTDVKFASFVVNPTIRRAKKKGILEEVLKVQRCSDLTINLFVCLAENGRLKNIRGVMNSFNRLMSAHRGEVVCVVTTAKPLDSGLLKQLEGTLKKFLKQGQVLQLESKVDPSLIGGMVVNIGDKYVDMSMASKINTYTNLIKQAI